MRTIVVSPRQKTVRFVMSDSTHPFQLSGELHLCHEAEKNPCPIVVSVAFSDHPQDSHRDLACSVQGLAAWSRHTDKKPCKTSRSGNRFCWCHHRHGFHGSFSSKIMHNHLHDGHGFAALPFLFVLIITPDKRHS